MAKTLADLDAKLTQLQQAANDTKQRVQGVQDALNATLKSLQDKQAAGADVSAEVDQVQQAIDTLGSIDPAAAAATDAGTPNPTNTTTDTQAPTPGA